MQETSKQLSEIFETHTKTKPKRKEAYNSNNGLENYDFIVLKYCALKIYKINTHTHTKKILKTKKKAFKCKEQCSFERAI